MSLNNKQLKNFRSIGHNLSPIVIIAKGLNANINSEIDRALNDHELIKLKVHSNDRDAKKALVGKICKERNAELVQLIGHVALIYKAAKKPNPKLSNILRHKQ
ncbi:MAG: ribosome assembly RNA-binding protein YhbY [SAR86 cluster bacterium]|uniref:Ribosome assembly RNA-binding protein YhbY n=1 Tax=SAR86 cluster bacterium TaxID=2030880 RepID=A0A2A5CGF5_9GAMM|nr:MAG: ribosome assembly RNA-binding protein YhbY [SAR86 cluster bacterium]